MTWAPTNKKLPFVFVGLLLLQVANFQGGCGAQDDSDNDTEQPCSPEFCHAVCLENCVDAGIAPWGGCGGACVDGAGCMCEEYLCDQDNCESWCIEDQGANGGNCVGLGCNCF